jgi:phosphopantothenoylcysteine decarboxylase/phosphopantothenate--cysteine ligase
MASASWGPDAGDQACGEVGMGRMLEPADLVNGVASWLQPKLLAGTNVLITAGPTFEPIDPVRGITNRSSGKMGYAIARAAIEAGATVTLVSGPTALRPPAQARLIHVETAQQMLDAVNAQVEAAQIFIGVAAVSDYQVSNRSSRKLKKENGVPALELAPTPDIIHAVASRPNPPFCVGFAAESEDLEANGQSKRMRKRLPLLAANLAQTAIGADDNELLLIDDEGMQRLPRAPKLEQARALVRHIAKLYRPQRRTVIA